MINLITTTRTLLAFCVRINLLVILPTFSHSSDIAFGVRAARLTNRSTEHVLFGYKLPPGIGACIVHPDVMGDAASCILPIIYFIPVKICTQDIPIVR